MIIILKKPNNSIFWKTMPLSLNANIYVVLNEDQ